MSNFLSRTWDLRFLERKQTDMQHALPETGETSLYMQPIFSKDWDILKAE